ncbi:MAG: hypothetical protein EBT36_10300 [Betaproteobacteria bacterium]|nr:hypothetical protein [Betaproteobacteria bacterium]HAB47509.1 hypothetical protein [Lautropia sp.]NBP34662.1 hypothetical protein [Betaproteobacteria bacterium]NBP38762.1 hypothetical protein [Betaproteobacteria bacterium]NBQ78615.1 hypothetical protein [Betaproteobacteria bacterium]
MDVERSDAATEGDMLLVAALRSLEELAIPGSEFRVPSPLLVKSFGLNKPQALGAKRRRPRENLAGVL